MTLSIILSIAEIFGLLSIGAASRYLRYIEERDIDRWSKLVLDFLYPAFIFSAITAGFSAERRGELWALPLIGLGLSVGSLVLGLVLKYGLRSRDPATGRTFLYFCAVNNYAYLPIVIVQNLWGGQAMLANLFYLTLGSTIATWTVGVGVLGSTDVRQMARNLMTPNLIATVAAIAVAWCGWAPRIPEVARHIISSAGSASIPMMVVLAGASLFRPAAWRISWQVLYVTLVRLFILPACAVVVLRLIPFSQDIYALAVIVALMPVAVSSVIFTRIFGGEPDFAASSSLVTTVAAIVTVPLALWLLFGQGA
ncbi:MAG: AEC family transporter [Chitinispirillaceae bacterium]|nr:AEC family transporter [Chitinispirillaceae bacterium]